MKKHLYDRDTNRAVGRFFIVGDDKKFQNHTS